MCSDIDMVAAWLAAAPRCDSYCTAMYTIYVYISVLYSCARRIPKHQGSVKRCRSGAQCTHLTAVPTELHACLMRAPASVSPSIGPHNRPQHGCEQRDHGQRLAASAQELQLIMVCTRPNNTYLK